MAIAVERSFTRAAKRCHVAQSSLSRQIRAMEISLDTRFFDCLPRDIRWTGAGKVFEKEASKTLEHNRRAISLVNTLSPAKEQTLRSGLLTLCDLPRLVETARRSAAQLAVECVTAYTPELVFALHRGRLDIDVLDLPIRSRGIGFHSICSEPLIAVLPHNHLLTRRPMVAVVEWNQWAARRNSSRSISMFSLGIL